MGNRIRFLEELPLNTYTRFYLFQRCKVFDVIKGKTVVDIGCGSGFFTEILSRYAKKVIAVDISKDNVECAKSLIKSTKVKYYNCDCAKLPLRKNSVDVVFCSGVVEHFPNPLENFKEFKRVLRKGGFIILTVDIRPKITGYIKKKIIEAGQKNIDYSADHPEMHKKNIFSDSKSPMFYDIKKMVSYLKREYSVTNVGYGGGIISNIIDTALFFLYSIRKSKGTDNISNQYSLLERPSAQIYAKYLLPIIKLIAYLDNYRLDAFHALIIAKNG